MHHDCGWHPPNPCEICQDANPRQRLGVYIKNVTVGTETFGLPEKTNAEKYAIK